MFAACWRAEGQRSPLETPGHAVNASTSSITERIGRFQFHVPDSMTLTGRSQNMYRFEITTAPMPAIGAEQAWNRRLTEIRALTPPPGARSALRQTLQLQPGVPAAWYNRSSSLPAVVTLTAMLQEDNHLLWITGDGDAGKEEAIAGIARSILAAFAPGDADGFSLGFGAITTAPSANESTRLSVEGPDGTTLTFATQTVQQPDHLTYTDVDEEQQVVAAHGGSLQILREDTRVVATMQGVEIRISASPRNEPPFLRFTWHFQGEPGNSARPKIDIMGSAPVARRAALETTWDAVLGSLRPIPAPKE